MKSIAMRIYGRVQGVFFRKHTKLKADELNIKGIVRNDPNGTVYIEAEGSLDAIRIFTDWCNIGSPDSKVEKIDFIDITAHGYQAFVIQH